MNYLAHAYLSFNHSGLLVGNMISDYVKGKKQFDYPTEIQRGIKLHRAIDEFTDNHAATFEIKKFFKPAYRLYAGPFTDVVYDYFLANDTNEFKDEHALNLFTQKTYQLLQLETANFPEKFSRLFPHMREQDWLYNYRTHEGMQKSFGGLAYRALYIEETETAYAIFKENKHHIQQCYDIFFPDVKNFTIHKIEELLHN